MEHSLRTSAPLHIDRCQSCVLEETGSAKIENFAVFIIITNLTIITAVVSVFARQTFFTAAGLIGDCDDAARAKRHYYYYTRAAAFGSNRVQSFLPCGVPADHVCCVHRRKSRRGSLLIGQSEWISCRRCFFFFFE